MSAENHDVRLREFVARIARMTADGEPDANGATFQMDPAQTVELMNYLIGQARDLVTRPPAPQGPVLSAVCERLILQGVSLAGSFAPDEVLCSIEEYLTQEDYDTARAFLQWTHDNGRKFGWNIQEVFAEYVTDAGETTAPDPEVPDDPAPSP